MAALDRIEASPIASGPLASGGGELRLLSQETRALVGRMRDRAEDRLFEDHARLGFESEKPGYTPLASPPVELAPEPMHPNRPAPRRHRTAPHRPGLRETVLASGEPTKELAALLGVSVVRVATIRREAGERCAFLSGSGLTAQQRNEIAASAEPTKALAERHSVAESLVNKLRKSGPQGALCAPAGASEDI
jgi:hypothetical protein